MSTQIATPKQTAGGGFAFEDKVVGYYLVWMLTGRSSFKFPGRILRIDCQVAVDGWEGFDDLLITFIEGAIPYKHAFSLKSNLQFSKDSAPADLVRSAWSLLLHHNSKVMNIDNDQLGLICVPYPDPPKIGIQSLLKKASQQTPTQLSERLPITGYASDVERNIHNSCSCPADLAKGLNVEQTLAGNILKKMSVIELDFESKDSSSEALALYFCSDLVSDGTNITAQHLWNALCQIAQRVRTSGGGITRDELFSEICPVVELRILPDFSEDWHHLEVWRDTELSAISDLVGGIASVDRDELTARVLSNLRSTQFVGVVGASGTGKTVIAKRIAEDLRSSGSVLWLKGERIRSGYVEALGSYHNLRHPLKEVLRNGKGEIGLIVLDGGERLLDESDFSEICLLLHALGMDRKGSIWRLLVTCREEAWERVQLSLMRAFGQEMPRSLERIDYPKFKSLASVWEAFPALHSLAIRPHLNQIMRNLKVLDLLASAIKTGCELDVRTYIGESELISWYWQQVVRGVRDGVRRDVLLRKLACNNADTGLFEIPEADLLPEELTLIEGLSDMLGTDAKRGMVSFVHDLIADWARFLTIVSHESDLASYGESRFTNPHWHTALRLYGVSLLEADRSGRRWKTSINAYPAAQDLFIESLVFAGNSQELISSIWSVLIEDEGHFLKIFLKRFQYVASIPNPQYTMLAGQMYTSLGEVRTWERIPLWMYWLGILYALVDHLDDLLRLVPIETARLSRSWLRYTPRDWPGRNQAATLALAVAQQAIQTNKYYSSEDDGQIPYKALLEAYQDKPDEVRDLLLKAAARRVPTKEDGVAFEDYEAPGTVTHMQSLICGGDRVAQEPWPDGPLYRVSDAFRAACLHTDALRSIMQHAPDLASEIILALLIEPRPPKMEYDYQRDTIFNKHAVCLAGDHDFYPRFYTRGPFLLFLRINPQVALQTIIKLIDFATVRWMERSYSEEDRTLGIDLPLDSGLKRFIGDKDVYDWYHGVTSPDISTSALMALEKWFYECMNDKKSIDSWIALILKTSESMAFLGVLSEVGRYAPELFIGPLRPLILILNTYYFEAFFTSQGGHSFGTPFSLREGEWFFNLAREWDTMKHRKLSLLNIAAHLFHWNIETRKDLILARKKWSEVLNEANEPWYRYKQMLIATFDEQNWKEAELTDGSRGFIFKEPDHLRTPPDQLERNEKQLLLLTLPMTCRNMLDKGKGLEAAQISSFFEKSKELLGFEPEDDEITQASPVANVILGTIAVLFILHRDWLLANPKEEKWCIEKLDNILSDPPPWSRLDMPESSSNDSWEHFACDIAPVIWAENLHDRKSRERIAWLVFAKHYSAVGILLLRSFECREILGAWFWQLLNLVLDSAAIRYDVLNAHDAGGQVDVSALVQRASLQFIEGKYSTEIPRWGKMGIENGRLWFANNHPHYYGKTNINLLFRIPKLDLQLIRAAFNSVFLPLQASSDWERERFFEQWDEALVVCLTLTRFFDKDGNAIDPGLVEAGPPYEYDNWVLERLAVVVAQMRPDDGPERYWNPILKLGFGAKHYVEHFLNHWFLDAKKMMDKTAFTQEWQRMLDFCLTLDSWVTNKGRSSIHLQSLWMSLIGLPRFATSLWNKEDSLIIEQMGTYFVKVAALILSSAGDAAHLLSWLSEPTAKVIRRQMLIPIAEVGLVETKYWWKEQQLVIVMARYLSLLWEEHGHAFVPDEKRLFLELLHIAAGTQEPLAMELQARIASRK